MTEQKKLEIAGRLRQLWEESDETYLSIAEAVGVRERTVGAWLSPTKPEAISYKSAKKVAAMFNVSIDWLWRGAEDIRVPADFLERFSELEEKVRGLAEDDAPRAKRAAAAARQANRKSPEKSPEKRTPKAKKGRGR